MANISRSDYMEWKRSACTKDLLTSLDDNCKMMMNTWSNKGYSRDTIENTAVAEAEILGVIQAYKTLIAHINNNTIIPLPAALEDA